MEIEFSLRNVMFLKEKDRTIDNVLGSKFGPETGHPD
jgi:hypothetical protein